MRVILDTNVVVSALLWGGTPERLIEAAGDGRIELFTSQELVAEFTGLLARPKFARAFERRGLNPESAIARYLELVAIVDAPPVAAAGLRDLDDVAVLACALAARVDAIVSGDADLLVLGNFRGIPILSPTECVARMAA